MNCDRCGLRPGTIRYTELSEGRAQKQLVCAECARELGFGPEDPSEVPGAAESVAPPAPPAVAKLFGVVSIEAALSGDAAPAETQDDRRCPECGLTATGFRAQSLFGCPSCYATFEDSLDPLLKRLHGAVAHRGRIPSGSTAASEAEPGQLRRELDDAIREQDYERAARLRDRLSKRRRPSSKREASGEGEAP